MDIAMSKETMLEAMHALPFQPFSVRLADGSSYAVPARDFISVSPKGRTVVIFGEGEVIKFLDVTLILEIERVDTR
ncbi:MAG: hypothetical protein QOG91_443 [Candidatus Parcubacteria bacterium]|jgi:hypothetical protein|nr:hypothetical protein [Candidatus Parcubacteria bacterium]